MHEQLFSSRHIILYSNLLWWPKTEGDSFEEKRSEYLSLCEDIEDIEDPALLKKKLIFDEAFITLVRVANLWYNKIAEKQEDIEKALKEMFEDAPKPQSDEGETEPTKEG